MNGSSQNESCAETAAPRFPSALPQYEFLEFLGGGGMGEIYKARHVHLDRLVVIKWLRTDLAVGPHMDARFAREMLAVGQLNHPNIVAATDAGIASGRRYLVMEYIDGIDLAELCRRVGKLPIADACEIVRQSAIGLAHAHNRGIVHRDIKPTNLMLPRDGMVKLLDLGLALLQQEGESGGDAPLTRADSGPFGTYDYMSPEQWNNSHDVDPRGDIYSLGCTLCFLLTGHAPFDTPQHKSATAKMRGHVLEAPPSIRKERPDVSKRLAAVIERTLAKDPAQRYQTAAELAMELEEFVPGCDLPSLSAAAHGMRSTGASADVRTDPESATLLVGSSIGGPQASGRKVKALSATGIDTAVGQARTNMRGVAGVRPKRSRGWIGWLVGGAIAMVLVGAGAGYWLSQGGKDSGADDQHLVASNQTGARPSDNASTSSTDAQAPNGADDTGPRVADPVTNASVPHSGQAGVLDAFAANSTGDGGDAPTAGSNQPGNPPADPEMAASSDHPPPPPPLPAIVPLFEDVPEQVAREQQPFSLLVSLTNQVELNGKIAFALAPGAPQGMRIDPVSGVIRWEPREEDGYPGARYPVTVLVKPLESGVEATHVSFEVRVEEVNVAPELAAIDGRAVNGIPEWNVAAREGTPLEVTLIGRDDDLPPNPLALEPMGRLPEGAKIVPDEENPRAWRLQWTPGENFGGEEPVRIPLRVKDGETASPVVTLLVKVAEVNVPPVFETIGGRAPRAGKPWEVAAREGEPLELTILGGDVDRPANLLHLLADRPLPDGAKIEPVRDQPRQWKLTWTPEEEHGGGELVEFSLSIKDESDMSEPAVVVVRVAEVNSAPVLPEFAAQTVGAGEVWTLDVPVADPDLPRQELQFELEQPEGMGVVARWLEGDKAPQTLRVTWRPDAVADLGATKQLKLRVRDNGEPALFAERTFEIEVGRYVRNSIGMEFALVPVGEFRMGNLDPDGLQKITPKAPPKPPTPNRPAGAPFRNPTQPGQPFDPAAPAIRGTNPAASDDAAGENPESAKPEAAKPDDLPARTIEFTQPAYFGAFEVTQQQFESVMGANPSYFSRNGRGQKAVADVAIERLPVDSVNYDEAEEFCRRLSARPEEQARGRSYRLPTEAEWEYACRAGTGTLFSTGDRLSSQQANFDGRYPLPGMDAGPFLERTAVIGSYEPNAFGIHDMHGNVSEWCHDWYAADAYEQGDGPTGPESGKRRVIRGGNYRSQWAYLCRSSIRDSRPPTDRVPRIGFRVVMEQRPVGPALPVPRE